MLNPVGEIAQHRSTRTSAANASIIETMQPQRDSRVSPCLSLALRTETSKGGRSRHAKLLLRDAWYGSVSPSASSFEIVVWAVRAATLATATVSPQMPIRANGMPNSGNRDQPHTGPSTSTSLNHVTRLAAIDDPDDGEASEEEWRTKKRKKSDCRLRGFSRIGSVSLACSMFPPREAIIPHKQSLKQLQPHRIPPFQIGVADGDRDQHQRERDLGEFQEPERHAGALADAGDGQVGGGADQRAVAARGTRPATATTTAAAAPARRRRSAPCSGSPGSWWRRTGCCR